MKQIVYKFRTLSMWIEERESLAIGRGKDYQIVAHGGTLNRRRNRATFSQRALWAAATHQACGSDTMTAAQQRVGASGPSGDTVSMVVYL